MSEFLPQCAKPGAISCSDWLYGAPDAQPPNHVCWHVADSSIERYIATRIGEPYLNVSYSYYWPVPLGARALRRWYDERRALEEANANALAEQVERGGMVWHWEADTDVPPPAWFAVPVPVGSEVALTLAAQRVTGVGSVWLLGLTELIDIVEGGRYQTWRHVQPSILIEPCAPTLGGLIQEANTLLEWYNGLLLGKRLKAPVGRPPGSKEYWRDREDFLTAVCAAVKAIEQGGQSVTQERVAEYLSNQRTRVPRPHATCDYSERQFRRDRDDFGFRTWIELKKACQD